MIKDSRTNSNMQQGPVCTAENTIELNTNWNSIKELVILQSQWNHTCEDLANTSEVKSSAVITLICSRSLCKWWYASSVVIFNSTTNRSILFNTRTGRIPSSHACRRTACVWTNTQNTLKRNNKQHRLVQSSLKVSKQTFHSFGTG
jgi:hypothetical protein